MCSSGPYIPINLIQSQQQCRPQARSRRPVSKTEPVLPKGWGCLIRCTEFCSQGCVVPAVAPCCMGLDVIALDWSHSFREVRSCIHEGPLKPMTVCLETSSLQPQLSSDRNHTPRHNNCLSMGIKNRKYSSKGYMQTLAMCSLTQLRITRTT